MSSTARSAPSQEIRSPLLGDAAAACRAGFAAGIRPTATLTVSEWADSERILSGKEGEEAGPWRTARTPYLREIMDCLSVTHPATDVVFRKASQIGGTECGHCWIGYVIDQAPGAMMYVLPSSDTSARTSKQRLAAMIEMTPALSRKIKPARSRDSGNTTRMKEFPGGVLVLASSKSAAELKSMPVRYLYADEIDEYPDDLDGQGDALALAERRTGGRGRTKRFKTSTPTDERSRIERLWRASDQRRYLVPCPHCAHEQHLVWTQIRYDVAIERSVTCHHCGLVSDGASLELDSVHTCPGCTVAATVSERTLATRATQDVLDVWYECAACAGRIDEARKTALLARGRWYAFNSGPRRTVGFALNALYSPLGWYSWRQAVVEYLASEGKPNLRKVWTNTVLGEPYYGNVEQPVDTVLAQRVDPSYQIRTVPAGGLTLIGSVDVQGNRLEAKVKAWGRGEESWLIAYEVLHGDPVMLDGPGTVWAQLDELLDRRWPHASGATLVIAATGIDTGGHCTQTVYEYCRRRAQRTIGKVLAIKGASRPGRPVISARPRLIDVTYDGRTIAEGLKLWSVGTDTAKELIYQRLNIETPGPACMHFPLGLPAEYYAQLTAERLKRVTNSRGYEVKRWEKDGAVRNEALDLEVYNYATAHAAGVTRANWDILEQLILAQAEQARAPVSAETNRAAAPPPPRGRVLGRLTGSPA
jgi:phage terminase large subunit GpA-like protein